MSTLPLTAREADLLRRLLVAVRPVVKGREQYGEKRKPHDAETWGDVWEWAFRGGGGQFVIATHSPIIMAYPDARIYVLGEEGIRVVAYRKRTTT